MNIDSIRDGVVIDHITAGKGMKLYNLLSLGSLNAPVAMIMNASSHKMGRKDIIKIDGVTEVDLNVIGYVDPGATVNIIKDDKLAEKKIIEMPDTLTDVIRCKNPRCITSTEQEIKHIFRLTDKDKKEYRCIYCETKAQDAD